jgi:hypothetical protein
MGLVRTGKRMGSLSPAWKNQPDNAHWMMVVGTNFGPGSKPGRLKNAHLCAYPILFLFRLAIARDCHQINRRPF